MKINNRTKIVATLGPASSDKEVLRELIKEGLNVARINFSHSSHDAAREIVQTVRELNDELNTTVAILADLQGPKLRIGQVEPGTVVEPGQEVEFKTKAEFVGNSKSVYMSYETFPKDVKPGERILLDDGKLLMEVVRVTKQDSVIAKVVQGGALKSNKGVNLPNTKVSIPCLTEKDLADLEVALEEEIEWIGLSFVRSSKDVKELREVIESRNSSARIISKIEKPEAVNDIRAILRETDGLMVARGDLGIEIPMQEVPVLQKELVLLCRRAGKPVIIATQMMESMIESMTPTRAEVNDVANSVLDGADAVMLSGETSVGKYPKEVIQAMYKIIMEVEETGELRRDDNPPVRRNDRYITDAICYNSTRIADQVRAKAIITMTHSGYTGFKISSHRPSSSVFVFTHNKTILTSLSLLWGTQVFYYDKFESTDDTIKDIKNRLKEAGYVDPGDLVINIASMPITDKGMTNMLKISEIF